MRYDKTMPPESPLKHLIVQTKELLKFQEELGLRAINTPPDFASNASHDASSHLSADRPEPNVGTHTHADASNPEPTSKEKRLQELHKQLEHCSRCALCKARTHVVFGAGSVHARLMFVGEAPGQTEDLLAEPFVGKAGELLSKMIAAMTLKRSQVYISNTVKCRPKNNRDPLPEEIATCLPFLQAQIGIIEPEVIIALGRHAAQTLLQTDKPLNALRGKWGKFKNATLMPTYHPAYLLRNPNDKRLAWQDLQKVMHRLGLNIPT